MAILTRDQALAADDLRKEEVQVPEWGGSVFVRNMIGTERDDYEAFFVNNKQPFKNIRARIAAATVCDEHGVLLFSVADVEALGKKSGAALDRIFDVAKRLSCLNKEDIDEMGND